MHHLHLNQSIYITNVFPFVADEITNWAGKAKMRRAPGAAKPPPPVRRSSSVTGSSISIERQLEMRASKPPIAQKPPVTSPKPKVMSPDNRMLRKSDNFPTPPPPLVQPNAHDDEGMVIPHIDEKSVHILISPVTLKLLMCKCMRNLSPLSIPPERAPETLFIRHHLSWLCVGTAAYLIDKKIRDAPLG